MQAGGGTLHLGENPVGPTWDLHHYFLGADNLGRSVAALLLYGGRSSLQIGHPLRRHLLRHRDPWSRSVAGLLRRDRGRDPVPADGRDLGPSRSTCWRISISTELLTHSNGFQLGPIHVEAASLWTPTIIIAFIFVPYVYRPVRGQVLSVVSKEFRRRRHRPGRLEPPADLLRHPAERGVHRDRLAPADYRDHDPDRVRACRSCRSACSRPNVELGARSSATASSLVLHPAPGSRWRPAS